jgi:hypothetical protein
VSIQSDFWNWFLRREEEFYRFDANDERERERLFEALATQLRKIDRDLCFEFGPRESKREFIISAGGIKRAFPAVTSIVAAAPLLERWTVIGFRPRRSPSGSIRYGGLSLDSKDVAFSLFEHGDKIGLRMFIRDYREDEKAFKVIAYLLLDEALGEYDVETCIGPIAVEKPDAAAGVAHPFSELPAQFDQLIAKLRERSQPT